jgi:hypothetical protein
LSSQRTITIEEHQFQCLEELHERLLQGRFYQDYDLDMELMGCLGRVVAALRQQGVVVEEEKEGASVNEVP